MDDAPELARLSDQLGYPTLGEQVTTRLAQILARSDHAVFIAEIPSSGAGPRVAGWVHGFVQRIVESDPTIVIGGLVVDENERGLGIGHALMEQIERWARAASCGTVTVRSNVVRERAHAFYKRLGYAPLKTQRVFRKTIGE